VDELYATLDALAGEDLAPSFGPALLDRLRPLLVAQNRLAAEVARTVREAEVSAAAEVDGARADGLLAARAPAPAGRRGRPGGGPPPAQPGRRTARHRSG
jgi:hypothetical protein